MVKSNKIKIQIVVLQSRKHAVLNHCNIYHLPIYLYNSLLTMFSFLAICMSLFSLIVEASVYHTSLLEIAMLVLVFTGTVFGVLTFLTSVVLNVALARGNSRWLQSSKVLLRWSSIVDMLMFFLGLWIFIRFKSLLNDMVDWAKFIEYYQEPYIRDDLDAMQKGMQCCGFKDYRDWDLNSYYACNSTGYSRCSVPFSCCKREHVDLDCVHGIRDREIQDISQFIYTDGCLSTSKDWYFYTTILLGSLAFYQVLLKWIISYYICSFLRANFH